jgi:glyoxylase-like metal-dependent hydrolase (beta-lactamase superfamily II)
MIFEQVYQGNLVEIFKISDQFYFRRGNLQDRGQCNSAFIVSDRSVAIIDAPPGAIEMIDEAEKLFHKPVTEIFITHGHWDHVDGLSDFLDKDITIYCSYRLLDTIVPWDKTYKAHFVGVDGKITFRLAGDIKVELFTLNDVVHSKWDMFIRFPELGVLCGGDCINEYQTAYFHSSDIETWIASLRKLAAEGGQWILPGHGQELFPYSYVNDFADHLMLVEKIARNCFDESWPNPSEHADERFSHLTVPEIHEAVSNYFTKKSKDTITLVDRIGDADAQREVRAILYAICRMYIR